MRCVLILLFVANVTVLTAQRAEPTGPTVFSGRAWRAMSASDRFYYVCGYQQSIEMAALLLPAGAKAALLANNFPPGFSPADFVEELDALFRASENVNIPLPLAYLHIAKKLRGAATRDEIEKDLIKLRSVAVSREAIQGKN